jgi:hypothetical protein
MTTTPEAIVDSLFICRALEDITGGAGELEVINLSYLGCLLAVYDGQPPSEWGYTFAATKSFAPFSFELAEAIERLRHSGLIEEDTDGFRLTPYGNSELTGLSSLRRFQGRLTYVRAACQSAMAIPLPLVTGSLAAEPQLYRALELSSLRPLLDEAGRHALISHFAALAHAVPDSSDLFVPAVVWLTYLGRQAEANPPGQIAS